MQRPASAFFRSTRHALPHGDMHVFTRVILRGSSHFPCFAHIIFRNKSAAFKQVVNGGGVGGGDAKDGLQGISCKQLSLDIVDDMT